ncbi:substrate-binding domain-containing protein [Vibrio sp. PP-XX7]
MASVQNNEALALLHEFHFPLCLVHNESVGEVPSVYVDNVKAGWDVADFLITSGHHRLGMIAGQFHASDRAKQRYAGFQRRIQQDEFARLEVLIEVDPNDVTPFALCDITAKDTAPTAWFCSNDLLALKLINHFHLQGLSVPGIAR